MKFNYYKPIISAVAVIATSPFISGQTACPDPWVVNTVYVEGDQVGANGSVYQCNAWPYDGNCGQAGFEPGENPLGLSNPNWEIAWTLMGSCDAPTTPIPHFDPSVRYNFGDMVTNMGKVWQCNAPWPHTPRCSQTGYNPGEDYNDKSLYLEAWEEIAQGPSVSPSVSKFPSALPSLSPSTAPSNAPSTSLFPTALPSMIPSASPSTMPSLSSSTAPSSYPSAAPSNAPSTNPSVSPSTVPSNEPSSSPSYKPSSSPSEKPSLSPSVAPSNAPSTNPSVSPSTVPSNEPSSSPSYKPSFSPSEKPSLSPSAAPSNAPSTNPSASPSTVPSDVPSSSPSYKPSSFPSVAPSNAPSTNPSVSPSTVPSDVPSLSPSAFPSYKPSSSPSAFLSEKPSLSPSAAPSTTPSASPSTTPSLSPSAGSSNAPSTSPSNQPSLCPNPPSPPTSFQRYWLVCGRSNSSCGGQVMSNHKSKRHPVRCCKDCPSANPGDGWLQDDRRPDTCSASIWGKSEDADGNCQHALNYNQAVAMCANIGGRLCTKEELIADCAAYTGCGHDFDLVWSSSRA